MRTQSLKYRRKLFKLKAAYDQGESNDLFFKAVRENVTFQYDNAPEYRKVMEAFKFSPEALTAYEDIKKIPFLPTLFFKKHEAFSIPIQKTMLKVTSSGTKGQFSNIAFDVGSLWYGFKMVRTLGHYHRLFSAWPTNYIVLGYKPHKGNRTGVTKSAYGATLFAPPLKRKYILEYGKEGYQVDFEGVIKTLCGYSKSCFPTRFMGFPSYTYFLLRLMEERGIYLKLKKGSKIMLAGGWKEHYTQQVDKQVLYDLAKKVLDVEEDQIVEFFGAVEHPIMYTDCTHHHFHVPVYSRVIIRDVKTLEPLPNGQVGLVELITPMVKATPIVCVMTDDLGILHDGTECGCGLSAPYLELVGRIGIKDIKTCAAGAADMLKGVKV